MSYLVVNTKTAAQLTADNQVLLPNQTGIETDTLLTKIGDGQTAWNSLFYDTPVKGAFEQSLSALTYRVPSSYAVTQAIAAAGGALNIEQVLINGSDANNQGIENVGNIVNTFGTRTLTIFQDSGNVQFWQPYLRDSSNGDVASVLIDISTANSPYAEIFATDGAKLTQIRASIDQVDIFGTAGTFRGAVYSADYSANYTSKSLVDKAYVDASAAAASALTATYVGFGSGTNVLTGSADLVWTGSQLTVNGTVSSTGYQISGAAATGTILRGNGTSFVDSTNTYPNTTGVGQILYATSANVIGSSSEVTHVTGAANKEFSIIGASTGRTGFYCQNTTNTAQSTIYMDNNRGAFASYGGFLVGGSTNALSLFGLTRADKLMIFADGASNLGFAIGTIQAQPFVLGSNNVERARLISSGEFLVGTATSYISSARLQVANSSNAPTLFSVFNGTAGASAYAGVTIANTAAFGEFLTLGAFSSSFTTSGITVQNSAALYTNKGAGFNLGTTSNTQVSIWTNNTKKLEISAVGNMSLGGVAVRATTVGTSTIQIFNGTAPVGTLANGVSIYSVAGKLWAMDAGGAATQLTP